MDDKLKKTVEAAVATYPEAFKGYVCAFWIINKDDCRELGGHHNAGACHWALAGLLPNTKAIVVNGHKATWNETNPEFLKWVVTEAPYNHGILNKDNEKEWRHQACVLDTEIVGKGGVLWSCKAARHFQEDTFKLKYWDQLRNEGLNGLQAFIGADILDCNGHASVSSHVSLVGYDTPANLRKTYDLLLKADRNDTSDAAKRGAYNVRTWGTMTGRTIKKPDGWGGFVEKREPGNAKHYAALLKEIFEGDPKNVG